MLGGGVGELGRAGEDGVVRGAVELGRPGEEELLPGAEEEPVGPLPPGSPVTVPEPPEAGLVAASVPDP